MPVHLFRYSGDPPDSDTLLSSLGVQGDYTYIVATLAMESARIKSKVIAPPHQRDEDGHYHLVFHKALRHWLRERRAPLLTRAEERVALARAAAEVAVADEALALQLRHDVFAWRDALAELAERGVDLALGLPEDMEMLLVNPGVGDLLSRLQEAYRQQQLAAGRQPFEDAAYAYLDTDYAPAPHIVLEGFTFLTPLQRRLIEVSDRPGVQIYLLHPYRESQRYGFQIMDGTYAPWLVGGRAPRTLASVLSTPEGDLRSLQKALFGEDRPAAAGDGSVTTAAHGHRHQEVADCVRRLRSLIDHGVSPDDIAIVTRNAGNIEALLREEAELQGLPVSLSVPPRLLLLTPLGRFVLTLYEVWGSGALRLDAGQLETILASGWLGGDVQATADIFSAVRAQFFARCHAEADWKRSLDQLAEACVTLPPGSRLSAALVTGRVIGKWRDAIARVRELCQRLFAGGPRSIGGHVQRLLDELTMLAPEQMRESEREVLERIREALTQVSTATSLAMSATEFGEVLNSLISEYDRAEGEEDGATEPQGRVWVTTPEGIDGRTRQYVFYLGIDSKRSPRAYAEVWPFYRIAIDEHQRKERYLFLAVVRAARHHLHLSYARADEDEVLRPSPYLEEVAELLGLDLHLSTLAEPERPEDNDIPAAPPLRARRSAYGLAEIAHAGLCPYRYKMERLSPAAAVYRDPFQLRFLAEGHWLDRILTDIRERSESAVGFDGVYAMLHRAMEATSEQVRGMFPGLRELDWHTARKAVDEVLRFWAQTLTERGSFAISVVQPSQITINVNIRDRMVEVDTGLRHAILKGQFERPFVNDLLLEEWLLPGARPEDDAEATTQLADGTQVFASLYHAVSWWRQAIRTAYDFQRLSTQVKKPAHFEGVRQDYSKLQIEMQSRIAAIEASKYPKHPGDHCRYCPVRLDCLGLEP